MVLFAVRRALSMAAVLLAIIVLTYGAARVLEPKLYGGQDVLSGTWRDVVGVVAHFDFGDACMIPGCPHISTVFARTYAVDLWLLVGGLVAGVIGGFAGGVLCALWPRSLVARVLDGLAALAYCTPVYVVGLGLLLLFEPTFGIWHLPLFLEPGSYAGATENPWDFFRTMLVPWLIVGAPLAGICLRLTTASILGELDEPYVRTAVAKGLSRRRVVARHAGRPSHAVVAALVGTQVRMVVTNMVLVEYVFFLPGFFVYTKRALGQDTPRWPPVPDVPSLQALAVWMAALVLAVSFVSELALAWLDPRVRGRA